MTAHGHYSLSSKGGKRNAEVTGKERAVLVGVNAASAQVRGKIKHCPFPLQNFSPPQHLQDEGSFRMASWGRTARRDPSVSIPQHPTTLVLCHLGLWGIGTSEGRV